jgi:hypothetical protein
MNKDAWQKSRNGPAFGQMDKVYGTGHASFVKSKNGLVDLMVYHAAKYQAGGWNRNVRIQKFIFHDNVPYFGAPIQPGVLVSLDANTLLPDGIYTIKSKYNGLYLTANKCENANTSWIVMSDSVLSSNALALDARFKWSFSRDKYGYYRIRSMCSGLNLDNAGGLLTAGNKIIQYFDNGNDAQHWHVEKMSRRMFKISNKRSLLYLDVPGGVGIPVIQWYSTNDDSQLFELQSSDSGSKVCKR